MEEVFKKADVSKGIDVDREHLTNLRFADDVALFNEKTPKTNVKTFKWSKLKKAESKPKNTQKERQNTWQTMQTVKIY